MTSAERRPSMPDGPEAEVLVVGGGPAGLAAAATMIEAGLRVTIIDSGLALGGQFWRHPPDGHDLDDTGHLHHDLATYRELIATIGAGVARGAATVLLGHHVWSLTHDSDGITLFVVDRSGPVGTETERILHAARLVLATGAHDRPLPFPGWDLPGVYTAGGLQALLKGGGVRAGSRVVVGGTGPFLLPVATGLADAGASVVVCEANDPRRWLGHLPAAARLPGKAGEGVGYAARLLRHRVPVRFGSAVVEAHGAGRVEEVVIARLDHAGRPVPGRAEKMVADAVGVSWGFQPQLDLAQTVGCALTPGPDGSPVVAVDEWQRSSVRGVSVAGELCGVGGAAQAVDEGRLAGEGVVRELSPDPQASVVDPIRLRRRIGHQRGFAYAMAQAHPVPDGWVDWLREDTTVCRCEEISVLAVRAAIADGASDARQVKQLTRAGMGWCQGRMCTQAVACLAGESTVPAVERLAAAPVPLGVLGRSGTGGEGQR